MTNEEKVEEIYAQINQWIKEIENLEDMIENGFERIHILRGEDDGLAEVRHKLKSVFSRD